MTSEHAPLGGEGATRLARHAAWYGIAGAFGKAAALLAVPYLTRQLGPDGYGLTDLATSLAGLLIVVVRFGADIPTMRLAATEPADRARFYSAFVLGTAITSVVGAAVLLPASGGISSTLWSSPGDAGVAIMALLLVPVSAVQFALINILRFVERPRAFAILAAVDLFAQLALAVLFVALGLGAFGAIAGYVVGSTFGLLVAAFAALPHLDRRIDLSLTKRILGEGLPFVPGAAAFIAADGISRMVAANFVGVAAVGHLALAIRIASVMSLSSVAFQMAWGPYGMGLQAGRSTRALFGRVSVGLIGLIAIAALGLGSLAPEITVLLGGDQFAGAAEVVPVLLVSAGLPAVLYVYATAAGIVRRGPWVGWSAMLGASTQVVAIALLLPVLGLPGFAVGAIVGRVTSLLVLGRGVADIADLPWTAVLLLAGAIGAGMWLQVLNADPAGTLPLRMTVAVFAAVAGAVVLKRWISRFRAAGLQAGGRPA